MISTRGYSPTCTTDSSFIAIAKVATAIAVIKAKPSHLTGQQYAAELATRFQDHLLDVDKINEKLKGDVLSLQQQLVTSQLRQAGSCPDDSRAILTPPCSTEYQPTKAPTNLDRLLHAHSQFYHSILNIEGSIQLYEHHTSPCLVKTTLDSCLSSIKYIRTYLFTQRHLLTKFETIHRVIQGIVQLTLKDLPTRQCNELQKELMKLAESMVDCIMKNSDINSNGVLTNISRMLVSLCQSTTLQRHILDLLVHSIHDFSKTLRKHGHEKQEAFPSSFENIYFILLTCENILSCEVERRENAKRANKISSNVPKIIQHSINSNTVVTKGKIDDVKVANQRVNSSNLIKMTDAMVQDECLEDSTQSCAKDRCNQGDSTSHKLRHSGNPSPTDRGYSEMSNPTHKAVKTSDGIDASVCHVIRQVLEQSQLHLSQTYPLFSHYIWRLTGILDCLNTTAS